MAGKPTRHGNGWRVRWTDPRDRRVWSHPVIDEKDGRALRAWIEAPPRMNRVRATDDELVYGTWRTGLAPAKLPLAMTFGEWAEKVITNRETLPPTKKRSLARIKNHFADWADLPVDQITRKLLLAKMVELDTKANKGNGMEGGLSHKYRADTLTLVAGLLRDAERAELIKRSPFRADYLAGEPAIKIPSKTNAPRLRTKAQMLIPPTEWAKMMRAAVALDERLTRAKPIDRHLALMMWTMAETGCRISEIHALWVENALVHVPEDAYIVVEFAFQYDADGKKKIRTAPKARSSRVAAITEELAVALAAFVGGRESTDYLFPAPVTKDGWGYESWWRKRWSPMRKLAVEEFGLDPRLKPYPHMTRHMHVTYLLNAGVEMWDVTNNVGHKGMTTTQGYSQNTGQHANRIRTKLTGFGPPGGA